MPSRDAGPVLPSRRAPFRGAAAIAGLLAAFLVVPPLRALSVNYLCFFDAGRAELSDRCEAILTQFATVWDRRRRGELPGWPDGRTTAPAEAWRVEIGAHLDAAEGAGDAGALDRRRGEAVAAFLVARGIPAALIRVMPFGAGRPLVPVEGPEPQNRRAELVSRSPSSQ